MGVEKNNGLFFSKIKHTVCSRNSKGLRNGRNKLIHNYCVIFVTTHPLHLSLLILFTQLYFFFSSVEFITLEQTPDFYLFIMTIVYYLSLPARM